MSKTIDKLKKQLLEISEVVNSFRSEAVQVRVVDKLLDAMIEAERGYPESAELFKKAGRHINGSEDRAALPSRKKPGATKVLNQLLDTDFFKTAHSIADIADHCRERFDSVFKTSELSGILLKLANENKLKRQRNDSNNRFEYVKA
jgi:hypothetical protein